MLYFSYMLIFVILLYWSLCNAKFLLVFILKRLNFQGLLMMHFFRLKSFLLFSPEKLWGFWGLEKFRLADFWPCTVLTNQKYLVRLLFWFSANHCMKVIYYSLCFMICSNNKKENLNAAVYLKRYIKGTMIFKHADYFNAFFLFLIFMVNFKIRLEFVQIGITKKLHFCYKLKKKTLSSWD